jgi:hypothetical protein
MAFYELPFEDGMEIVMKMSDDEIVEAKVNIIQKYDVVCKMEAAKWVKENLAKRES